MLFLPYKMDSRRRGLPIITVLICAACLVVYATQYKSENRFVEAATNFCKESVDLNTEEILQRISDTYPNKNCIWAFEKIREADDRQVAIDNLVSTLEPLRLFATVEDNQQYMASQIDERARRYALYVPRELTQDLAYDPNEPQFLKMITSTFSHGSLMHLLGNLLFFFVFGASVELIIGFFAYALFIAVATIGTSLGYSYLMIGVEGALPTIGLSGVVMATLAALGVMMPRARIRCFFWFIWIFRIFRIPAYLLVVWYVGWDLYELNRTAEVSLINYASHVTGALIGGLVGATYFVFAKETISRAEMAYAS